MDIRSIIPGFFMGASTACHDLKKASSLSFSFSSGPGCGPIYPAREHPEPVERTLARLLQIEPEIVQYADRFKFLCL